jgi:SAM-dependent methyltransferase
MNNYKEFYNSRAQGKYISDGPITTVDSHYYSNELKAFVERFELKNKRCLERGAGKGIFQDLVEDYTGLDVSEQLRIYHCKKYFALSGEKYPFEQDQFDGIWSFFCHEHIPNLQKSLIELKRVLKPGGVCLFGPAWQCASWLAQGYCYRKYSDLNLMEKTIKASIPIRRSIAYRSLKIFPKRIVRHVTHVAGIKNKEIKYRRLKPNYSIFWGPDSDACNSIDPHDAILWFTSNGFTCLSHQDHLRQFLVRTGALIFQKSEK